MSTFEIKMYWKGCDHIDLTSAPRTGKPMLCNEIKFAMDNNQFNKLSEKPAEVVEWSPGMVTHDPTVGEEDEGGR